MPVIPLIRVNGVVLELAHALLVLLHGCESLFIRPHLSTGHLGTVGV